MFRRLIFLMVIAGCIQCASFRASAQPGKFAGSLRTVVGKTFTDNRSIPGLKGWQYREGTTLTSPDDPEVITSDLFQRGSTYAVLFSIKEKEAEPLFVVSEVIEIKNVLRSQHVRTGVCKEGENASAAIVAVVKKELTASSKAVRAWRFNMDKRRVVVLSPARISCLNEGVS